ncbi:TfpX/TfpZ family type IV pilin accessory protein [Ramlibacter sp. PS4R-6]|uniref:TfpX/TfpZ family type IV pilin accessory protein n=1 Tax=Ramlibacter sp. PS4R-6 TaxID=3133438 RepID=UPI0030B410CB
MVIGQERLRAALVHLAISAGIAALAATLVFALWYPYPYRDISGGRELFLIVTGVDVILGPLITLTIFNLAKPRRELVLDLSVVACIQLAALGYGLWTVAVARPVHMVFEFDRLRVVHGVDVPEDLLAQTPPGVQAEPWGGPTLLAVRPFRDANENMQATLVAMQGIQLAARPDLWQPYDQARPRVTAAAQPVEALRRRMPAKAPALDAALASLGRDAARTKYLPLVSRKLAWVAFIEPATGDVVGFAPVDPY